MGPAGVAEDDFKLLAASNLIGHEIIGADGGKGQRGNVTCIGPVSPHVLKSEGKTDAG